jgi:hypothetical protein
MVHATQAAGAAKGVLWRVVKGAREMLESIEALQTRVIEPFRALVEQEGALEVVPNFSEQCRRAFVGDVRRLSAVLETLTAKLSVAAYIAKRDCKHEEHQMLRRRHSEHVTGALNRGRARRIA